MIVQLGMFDTQTAQPAESGAVCVQLHQQEDRTCQNG